MRSRPTIIVLAAGRGSRFRHAQHKLAQPLGLRTVLGHTLMQAVRTQLPVLAVCSAPLAEVAGEHLAARDILVLNEAQAARGMGHSIALGVAERSGAPGWLVLPGDMPLVQPSTLLAVARGLEQHPVAYAQHRGRRGHPVGFSAELYSDLVRLDGDEGARRLMARYPAEPCEVDDPGVLLDGDTVEDLQRARERLRNNTARAAAARGPDPGPAPVSAQGPAAATGLAADRWPAGD
jgi:molybdenum cofactor cytidylyltransferase